MNISFSDVAPYALIAVILLINIFLWVSLRSRGTREQFDLLRKAGKTLQKPWEKEDRALQELSEKVSQLKNKPEHIQNDRDF